MPSATRSWSTGAVSLNGATVAFNSDVAIAANKDVHMTIVPGTFASGIGAVLSGATIAVNGDVAIAADKDLHRRIVQVPSLWALVLCCFTAMSS